MARWLLIVALALAVSVGLLGAGFAKEPAVVTLPSGDPEMAAAITTARASLPRFWEKFAKPAPDESGFALKVAVPTGASSSEHIWLTSVEREGGKLSGLINNVPQQIKSMRAGQRVGFSENQISDWMFLRSGKIVGNYTMRPLLKRMDPREAAKYRAMLEEP